MDYYVPDISVALCVKLLLGMVKDGIWDTGTIVKGVACGAAISALLVPRVRDWIEASGRTWMMQLGYMAQQPLNLSWPFVQYEIWTVMSLEKVHMLESLAARRQGTDLKALKHLDPNLPHVDNQSSRATKVHTPLRPHAS